MLIDYNTGRIAYHGFLFSDKPGQPTKFVQYDFDGSVKYTTDIHGPLEDFTVRNHEHLYPSIRPMN